MALVGDAEIRGRLTDEVSRVSRTMASNFGKAMGAMSRSALNTGGSFNRLGDNFSQLASSLGPIGASIGALVENLGAIADVNVRLATNLVETGISMEGVRQRILFASNSAAEAEANFEFFRSTVNRVGLSFEETSATFAKFQAAITQSNLSAQEGLDIFEAFAEASSVLRLSGAEAAGIFLALEQMVSRGFVSMEELRRQLGNRLPGAFEIAARSMNITTVELQKLVSSGELATSEFLPRFAAEVKRSMADSIDDASQSVLAAFNRLRNAFFELRDASARVFLPALGDLVDELARFAQSDDAVELAQAYGEALRDVVPFVQDLAEDLPEVVQALATFAGVVAEVNSVVLPLISNIKSLRDEFSFLIELTPLGDLLEAARAFGLIGEEAAETERVIKRIADPATELAKSLGVDFAASSDAAAIATTVLAEGARITEQEFMRLDTQTKALEESINQAESRMLAIRNEMARTGEVAPELVREYAQLQIATESLRNTHARLLPALEAAQNRGFIPTKEEAKESAAAAKRAAAEFEKFKSTIESLTSKFLPLTAASEDYFQALEDLNEAVERGLLTQEQANIAIAAATQAWTEVVGPVREYEFAAERLADELERIIVTQSELDAGSLALFRSLEMTTGAMDDLRQSGEAANGLRDLFENVADDLGRALAQAIVSGDVESAIEGLARALEAAIADAVARAIVSSFTSSLAGSAAGGTAGGAAGGLGGLFTGAGAATLAAAAAVVVIVNELNEAEVEFENFAITVSDVGVRLADSADNLDLVADDLGITAERLQEVLGGDELTSTLTQFERDLINQFNQLLVTVGANLDPGFESLTIAIANKFEGGEFIASRVIIDGITTSFETIEEATGFATQQFLRNLVEQGVALDEAVRQIVEGDGVGLDIFQEAVERVQSLADQARMSLDGVSALELALERLPIQMDALRGELTSLGLSADQITRLVGGQLVASFAALRQQITGEELSVEERRKIAEAQRVLFNAQIELEIARLEAEKQALLAEAGIAEQEATLHGNVINAQARFVQARGDVANAELGVMQGFVNGAGSILRSGVEIIGDTSRALGDALGALPEEIRKQVEAIQAVIDALRTIGTISPGDIRIPGVGGGLGGAGGVRGGRGPSGPSAGNRVDDLINSLMDSVRAQQDLVDTLESSLGGLQDFLDNLQIGAPSNLTPGRQVTILRQQLQEAAAAARMGDIEQIDAFQRIASQLRTIGAEAFGTAGAGFASLLREIERLGTGVLDEGNEVLESQEDILSDLRSEFADLLELAGDLTDLSQQEIDAIREGTDSNTSGNLSILQSLTNQGSLTRRELTQLRKELARLGRAIADMARAA